MNVLKGIGASLKRGQQQVLQKVGVREESKDDEYEEAKRQVAICKEVFREVDKLLRALAQNIRDLSSSFQLLSLNFSTFRTNFKAEQVADVSSDFLRDSVAQMQSHAKIFSETVTGNSLELTKAALESFDKAETSHTEIREVWLDMDGLRHEVRVLTDQVHDGRVPQERREKLRQQLTARTSDLEKVAQRHSLLLRDAKKDHFLAAADASASLWSIYSLVFRQSEEHFSDMAGELQTLLRGMLKAKQGQSATADRAAVAGDHGSGVTDGVNSLCERARAAAAHVVVSPPSGILPLECTPSAAAPPPPAAAQPRLVMRESLSPQQRTAGLMQWGEDPFATPPRVPDPPAPAAAPYVPPTLPVKGLSPPLREAPTPPQRDPSSGARLPPPERPPPERPPPQPPAAAMQHVSVAEVLSAQPKPANCDDEFAGVPAGEASWEPNWGATEAEAGDGGASAPQQGAGSWDPFK
eukprot:TRINITY_DN9498_c1_g2_i1.p1 TRINITY_DN9498_c1_g2~~TRINITY_DN9498_c1_g2_i1.p1  ORF type:complete len:467 (+),score=182.50 TRINITY_DN9498_c1_g2_i1:210-1610(+)